MGPSPDPGHSYFKKGLRKKWVQQLTLRVETTLLNNNDTPFCP